MKRIYNSVMKNSRLSKGHFVLPPYKGGNYYHEKPCYLTTGFHGSNMNYHYHEKNNGVIL